MESKNYYEILGVSRNATLKEIVAAKNKLAKKYHPDSNVQYNIDTTEQMQVILEAYRVLSDTKKRAKYDRKLKGIQKEMQTFDLNKSNESSETDSLFVQCWRACGELYDLLEQSKSLYKDKTKKKQLSDLATRAMKQIIFLRTSNIPEQYWHPDTMNWLLLRWYQNRNCTISHVLSQYDQHIKENYTPVHKMRENKKLREYHHTLKKLLKY